MTDTYNNLRFGNKSPSLTESERIAKLKTKLNSAQKNLHLNQSNINIESKLFSLSEEPINRYQNKNSHNILKDSSNISAPEVSKFNYKQIPPSEDYTFISKPLSLEDLGSLKDIELGEFRLKILNHILDKVEVFKKNKSDRKALLQTEFKSLQRTRSSYYNYIEEGEVSVLVYLITTLYREIETLCQSTERTKPLSKSSNRENETQKEPNYADSGRNLTARKYNSRAEIVENNKCECQPFLAELKEYFKIVNQGLLCSHKDVIDSFGQNYYEMTASILKKFNQVNLGVISHNSSQPNSISDLFISNKQLSGISQNKGASEKSFNNDGRLSDLLQEIEKLKKEKMEMTEQILRSNSQPKDYLSVEGSLVMKELKKVIQQKEELELECRNLKRIISETEREFREEREEEDRMSQEGLNLIDIELNKARSQISHLLEKKETAEKQTFMLKVEKDSLLERIKATELKLQISNDYNETMRKQLIIQEETIQEKSQSLEKLKFQRDELEIQYNLLKDREKEVERYIKQEIELENNINQLTEEIKILKQSIKEKDNFLDSSIKEKEFIQAKYETLDSFNPKYADPHIIEQISTIIIGRLSQSDLNNETKVKLQKMFGEKFVVLLAPLKKKLKKAESIIKETKNKYKEKINQYIDKIHEVESLSTLLLQVFESVSKAVKSHTLVGIGLLNEELQRKRSLFIDNIEKGENEKEANLRELTKIYEENAESDAAIFTEIPNFSFPEADNLLKENEALKLQLHEQDNEISNLTAQLKFSNSVTENKKKNKSSKKMSETDRMEKFFNKTYNSEGEEETFETLNNISKYDEIYLMLRAQASSLELLLNDIQ